MDTLKEIFEALHSRVRSPIFGSIAFAFIIINWKALYFLTFASTTVTARIQYFDDQTSWLSILVGPIIFGMIFAIASPWIALFSAWISEQPTTRRKLRYIKSADKILTEKLSLEQTRTKFLATQEQALIDAAKRDEEVNDIQDPQIQNELRSEIEELRNAISIQRKDAMRAAAERSNGNSFRKATQERLSQLEMINDDIRILNQRMKKALEQGNQKEIELINNKLYTRQKRLEDLVKILHELTSAS